MSRLTELAERPLAKLRPSEKPPPAAAQAGRRAAKAESAELVAQRDRLLEKFTVMQADLGGAFYEMAIRDHVRLDVLTRKAAELQRVDAELLALERLLELERSDAAGHCPGCGSPFGHARPLLRPVRARPRPDGGRPSEGLSQPATTGARSRRRRSLSGKSFALLVASSLVATTAIVAAAVTSASDLGALAGLLGRSLAANTRRPRAEPAASPGTGARTGRRGLPEPASGAEASPSASLPAPEPSEPEPNPRKNRKKNRPRPAEPPAAEAGQIQHVFVISLASPGYDAAFGATPQMPYLASTLRPQGSLLTNYKLLDRSRRCRTRSRRSAASRRTPRPGQTARPTPSSRPGRKTTRPASSPATAASTRPKRSPSPTSSTARRLRWHAYMEGMVDPRPASRTTAC